MERRKDFVYGYRKQTQTNRNEQIKTKFASQVQFQLCQKFFGVNFIHRHSNILKVVTLCGATAQLSCNESCQLMQRFSVCRSLGQSRFVHVRLVSLEIRLCLIVVVLACCTLPMPFVLTWTINIITCFCGWRCIGEVFAWVITERCSISLILGSFIVFQVMNNSIHAVSQAAFFSLQKLLKLCNSQEACNERSPLKSACFSVVFIATHLRI